MRKILISIFVSFFSLYLNASAIDISAEPQISTDMLVSPPENEAKSFVLMYADSGQVLASKNADLKIEPASLTKMMTAYIVSEFLSAGSIHLNDEVFVSMNAWKSPGSKMFLKVRNKVQLSSLMQGIIVDSGNDACVAVSEYIAGSVNNFVNLMNKTALKIGMRNTHFENVNGLPQDNHYTSAMDMAVLARALIKNHPDDYKWYSQKWFEYGGIKQPNRNRLLWLDKRVDGIKTGHTQDAGYCLVASAKENSFRLISVLIGDKSDSARMKDSENLLQYGFRFFKSIPISLDNPISYRVLFGKERYVKLGFLEKTLCIPSNIKEASLVKKMSLLKRIEAPVSKGQILGTIDYTYDNNHAFSYKAHLIALESDPKAGFFRILWDRLCLFLHLL